MVQKPHLNLVAIGHVDHGKSTLLGRLLWDTGNIREEEMRKIEQIAKELGKETFEFAFVMDTLKEERERGLTIDIRHQRFDTPKYYFTIIDAPGHRDFVKNMITGASQADAAILVVDVVEGVQAQTKEHAYLAKVLGINQLIVAINKMDKVNYDKEKFEARKEEVLKLLRSAGFTQEIPFIPLSGYKGDNVVKKSTNMNWYTGNTLIEALDNLKVPEQPINLPLRLPIQDAYNIKGVGTVPVGRVETGRLRKGDTLIFQPASIRLNKQITGEVKSIEMHHQEIPEAVPGDNIGFNIRGVSHKDIKRGDVAGLVSNPPTVAKEFTAQIIIISHPNVIARGYTPVFHINTAQVACEFVDIIKTIDPKTGGVIKENPDYIKQGESAIVKIKPTKPVVIERNKDFPQLSRFAIRDMGMTVGAGVCIDLVPWS
jgi:elongation factor 1-alpha